MSKSEKKASPEHSRRVEVEKDYIEPEASPHVVDLRHGKVSEEVSQSEKLIQPKKSKELVIDLQKILDFWQTLFIRLKRQLVSFYKSFNFKLKRTVDFQRQFNKTLGQQIKSQLVKIKWWVLNSPYKIKALPQKTVKASNSLKSFFVSRPMPGWLKPLLTFALICFLLILPLRIVVIVSDLKAKQDKVLNVTTEAVANLQAGTVAVADLNLGTAKDSFNSAAESFNQAQKELAEINNLLVNLAEVITAKGRLLNAGKHLVQAGQYLAQVGAQISVALEGGLSGANLQVGGENQLKQVNFLTLIKSFEQSLEQSLPNIKKAQQEILQVKATSLPKEYSLVLQQVQDKLPSLEASSQRLLLLTKTLCLLLGDEQPRRYLLIFQNNNELRPSGGFIGSIAIIDFYQGQIKNLEVPKGGPYDIAGWTPVKVTAPLPLRLVNPVWSIQDANWFVDFPTSAKKIIWFYEKAWGGSSIDGIITLTPDIITQLLALTGPIEMPDYGKVIDQDNFIIETQKAVELEYDQELNQPKSFISDLTPELLNRVLSLPPDKFPELIQILAQALSRKQILLYSEIESLQRIITDFGWAGEIKKAPEDYLLVVDSNIGGGKTNSVVDQLINYQVVAEDNGELTAKVEITRIHRGIEGDLFTGIKNISYLRVYVPQGSQLLTASGFEPWYENMLLAVPPDYENDQLLLELEQNSIRDELTQTRIYQENGKTVFANWIGVEPGKSAIISFTYKLPFKLEVGGLLNTTDGYSLLTQNQPGSRAQSFTSSLQLPADWQINWYYPKTGEISKLAVDKVNYHTVLVTDNHWGVVVSKQGR